MNAITKQDAVLPESNVTVVPSAADWIVRAQIAGASPWVMVGEGKRTLMIAPKLANGPYVEAGLHDMLNGVPGLVDSVCNMLQSMGLSAKKDDVQLHETGAELGVRLQEYELATPVRMPEPAPEPDFVKISRSRDKCLWPPENDEWVDDADVGFDMALDYARWSAGRPWGRSLHFIARRTPTDRKFGAGWHATGFWGAIDRMVKIAARLPGTIDLIRAEETERLQACRERVAEEKRERSEQARKAANARWAKKSRRKAA